MRKIKNSGVIMISVMIIVMFMVIFATAILAMVVNQQKNVKAFYHRQASLKAAEAGINYAMCRLENYNGWKGCSPSSGESAGEDFTLKSNDLSGVVIYEHSVDGILGCIEGKVPMGNNVGYFDMYFKMPTSDASMHFFKDKNAEANSLPKLITLCKNNIPPSGSVGSIGKVYDSQNNLISSKSIPPDSVLIVCRGTVSGESQIIETCFRFGTGENSSSVIIGRKDLKIKLTGTKRNNDMITIDEGADNKPSMLRTLGDMELLLQNSFNYPQNDYLAAFKGSGGRTDINTSLPTKFNPIPKSSAENFSQEPDQKRFLPKLTLDSVKPDTSSVLNSLDAGTYLFSLRDAGDPKYSHSPKVTYYKNDDPTVMVGGSIGYSGKDVTSAFESKVDSNLMTWDPKIRKVTFLQSCKVDPATKKSGSVINGVIFTSPSQERLTVQIGADVKPDETPIPVYLVNDNSKGSIYIDGQLSGNGTVVCEGNLDMEAESQLDPNQSTSMSIYAGGDLEIHEIEDNPFLSPVTPAVDDYDIRQSVIKKINQFKVDNEGKLPYCNIYNTGIFEKYDQYAIPKNIFNSEEQEYLAEYLFKDYLYVDTDKVGNLGGGFFWYDNYSWSLANTGQVKMFRLPYLISLFDTPDKLEDKYDSKGMKIGIKDSIFRGMIYACGNFKIDSPKRSFILDGGLVAFGGDTKGNETDTGGNINITARDCRFRYNSKHLSLILNAGNRYAETLYWTQY